MHVRAILPDYQSYGIGKKISEKLLNELQPDFLFTTCVQSPSLHSWVSLPAKRIVSNYTVYPRIETTEGQANPITVPLGLLETAIDTFRLIYNSHVKGSEKRVDDVVKNITVHLVRKNVDLTYNYNPWAKEGKNDELAEALGLETPDGVLVMFMHNRQLSIADNGDGFRVRKGNQSFV